MSRAWLLDVLDRELADKVGAERDRIADAVLEALPVDVIAATIAATAQNQLRYHCMRPDEARRAARDVAANAAMAVAGVLGDDDLDEQKGIAQ